MDFFEKIPETMASFIVTARSQLLDTNEKKRAVSSNNVEAVRMNSNSVGVRAGGVFSCF